MPLSPGTRLGTYEIISPLGSGGMGEVYRARDLRLGRDVWEFKARFRRHAFGWRLQPDIQRIKQRKRATRKDFAPHLRWLAPAARLATGRGAAICLNS